jgi:phospholipase/carboxylesterase/glyoxalase family protein
MTFKHVYKPATVPGGPTLLLLHGTGGDEHDLISLGEELLPDAGILSPRGQVLEGAMPRFFRRLAEGVFDIEDLRLRTAELADFVKEASAHYALDIGHVTAVGFSNGANIAASLLLLNPGLLRGAILFRAMVPLVPDPLPEIPYTPVLLSNGRSDRLIAPEETERLASLLRAAGADVTLAWQESGHGLTRDDVAAAQKWLRG